jgi:hypothetical protein
MSANKTCNEFQKLHSKITEEKIAKIIKKVLRENFPEDKLGIRQISNKTNIDERSVWNWYNGLYAPSLLNFIMLSQKFPDVIKAYLELCNMPEIWDIYQNYYHLIDIINKDAKIIKYEESYSDIFPESHVTINFSIIKKLPNVLNERQKWFLQELRSEAKTNASDLSEKWDVSIRTAKRDIQGMKKRGLIYFSGSKRYGKYYTK